ncbi:hypothetical protein [Pedobacter rhizosphaerae]|uniref:Uncharacterized protein n=1 Tax=Pedobacter rhizosphaerae TaxID=390241 RepID=A0A1H9KUG1_9SPHI|nr:hypothetical protein [Pedobacter rhizosphaerae]SER02688.1 hypothetical protein SAMN04488023_103148 [Pedobacter rhizosphaerae]
MESKKEKSEAEDQKKTTGTSKEKATFDQNGKGASDKYGEAGESSNESGDEDGPGTTNKHREK